MNPKVQHTGAPVSTDLASPDTKGTPINHTDIGTSGQPSTRVNWKTISETNLVVFLFGILVTSFTAGIGAYRGLLYITNQETVFKGSYELKKDIIGPILKHEAVREIENLIDNGGKLQDDDQTRIWLLQVLTFVQQINLEKNVDDRERRMSTLESNIWYALSDPSVKIQSQKVLGILKGWRSAFRATQDRY